MQQFIGQIPDASNINRTDIGDGLNTGGYQFNIQNNRTRDNMTGKVDYVASPKNVFSWTMLWNRDIVDRTDLANDYSTAPKVKNDAANQLDVNALIPGVRVTDLGIGAGLLTLHAGILASVAQTFNVANRTSGFVPGAPNVRDWRLDNHAFYFNDNWRVNERFTIHVGTRWEYFSPVTERNGLTFVPVLQNNNAQQTLLDPNGTLDFAGSAVGRPYYKRDLNNFGPNMGIAWRPFGNKTVIRAGYSINFPNDEFIRSIDNNVSTSEGLSTAANRINLTETIGSTLPPLATPTFTAPRTFAQNYAVNSQTAFGMPNPDLVTPYVQQWNFSIQREISKGVLQVSYIGNKATKQFRAFDFNQVIINNGLLEDFDRARNNGNLARNATGTFNPAYNPNIPGSQPTPFFNSLPSGGLLNNTTIRGLIDSGSVGELANTYQINRLNGNVSFYQNRNALGTNMMTNYSNATYHSLQLDYRRRYAKGYEFQVNYVFSKSLSDTLGDGQARFEAFLDLNNAAIEKAPSPFDQRHALKANGVYELPFGRGRHWDLRNPVLNQMFGGWNISGIFTLTSGSPFGIFSGRGTFNRAARSGPNTVNTTLNYEQLKALTDVRKVGNGVYFLERWRDRSRWPWLGGRRSRAVCWPGVLPSAARDAGNTAAPDPHRPALHQSGLLRRKADAHHRTLQPHPPHGSLERHQHAQLLHGRSGHRQRELRPHHRDAVRPACRAVWCLPAVLISADAS
jgi:hypothetical protein